MLNLKQNDAFFPSLYDNPVKINENVVDTMTISLFSCQKPLFANTVLRILVDKFFQPLTTYHMIFKTNKIVDHFQNDF